MVNVAVLMSTYNGEKYLKAQIESILSQRGDFHLDLCVRDDGSTDRTRAILESYAAEGKLTWYYGENLGPAKSFFDLLYHSPNYEYYAFSDQDDVWFPDKIQHAISALKEYGDHPSLYFARGKTVDSDLNELSQKERTPVLNLQSIAVCSFAAGCTMLFNKTLAGILRSNSIPNQSIMHDYFVLLLCKAVGGDIFFDDRYVMYYRQHGNNVIGSVVGVKNKIIDRLKMIFVPCKVSIANQASEILRLYNEEVDFPSKKILRCVADYKHRISCRLKLVLSPKVKSYSCLASFVVKLSLLLGNR
ncbi:glycosyltransferase [uncultured Coprobacter sp.]|uniref:glycosyltransferase n=1 Tax=uncultured Coprobacter sp. TaxID=1720550 RepID=UPI002638D108|nr:glycosyltransferase [uncultured Coprobacter sp.]